MSRTCKKPRVEDYILTAGADMERIVRVCISTKGRTKGKRVAVTINRRVPVLSLKFNRKLGNRLFYNLA